MFKSLDHSIEFHIIRRIPSTGLIKFLAIEGDMMSFWLSTPPTPTCNASHATSNILEKSGNFKTRASPIFVLISVNALLAAVVHTNFFDFKHSVIRVMMVLKFRIKCRKNVTNPWKLHTSKKLRGVGHLLIAWTLVGSASTPWSEIMNPRKYTRFFIKEQLPQFT